MCLLILSKRQTVIYTSKNYEKNLWDWLRKASTYQTQREGYESVLRCGKPIFISVVSIFELAGGGGPCCANNSLKWSSFIDTK